MPSFWYGSKKWANWVLKLAIKSVNDSKREIGSRRIEVVHILNELEAYGYKWQAARLRNHINLAIKKGNFSFTEAAAAASDINSRVEEASS